MGIRGLHSFFSENSHLYKSHKLHDTPVIIDGDNLVHVLYHSYKLDCVCGGDYDGFASVVKQYLSSYIACNINPIIVFDGAHDKSERKTKTILERSKQRLRVVQNIVKYGTCSGRALPLLSCNVFRTVLLEMGITFAQCDYEADDHLTALANYYKCPVISNDSDFYICDVHHGFIYLDSVEPHVENEIGASGLSYKFLRCKIYHIDRFLSCFPGIDKNVLPLFGVLTGNDFVDASVFENFLSNIHLPKYNSHRLVVHYGKKKIVRILSWLRYNTLHEAKHHMLNYLKRNQRENIRKIMDSLITGYMIQNSHLACIIENRFNDKVNELRSNTVLTTRCGLSLPYFFIVKFNAGKFPPFFLNTIVSHKNILPIHVEDVTQKSTIACSRYIRQALYGILLHHDSFDNTECKKMDCIRSVEEYDFCKGTLHIEHVNPLFAIEHFGELPKLNEVDKLNSKKAKEIICAILGDKINYFNLFPDEWQLLIGIINYWLRSDSPPMKEFVYALILNILYFGLIKPLTSHVQKPILKTTIQKNLYDCSICDLKASVTPAMAEATKKSFNKYLQKPACPLTVNILHCFNQFQACTLYSIWLNDLFSSPFKHPKIHKSFSGVLLYNLTKDLMTRTAPELFVSELLGKKSALGLLFVQLQNKIFSNSTNNNISKAITGRKSRSRNKRKKKYNCDKCGTNISETATDNDSSSDVFI